MSLACSWRFWMRSCSPARVCNLARAVYLLFAAILVSVLDSGARSSGSSVPSYSLGDDFRRLPTPPASRTNSWTLFNTTISESVTTGFSYFVTEGVTAGFNYFLIWLSTGYEDLFSSYASLFNPTSSEGFYSIVELSLSLSWLILYWALVWLSYFDL